MRPFLVLVVSLMVVVSGCASDDKKEQDDATGGDGGLVNNTTTAPKVFTGTGSITASAGVVTYADEESDLEFQVAAGATLLFAEIAWDDAVQDINLALASPSSEGPAGATSYDHTAPGGRPGAPDSPHSLTLSTPEVGDWLAGASANGASGQIAFRLAATVFYGETAVPEGYSAL